MPSTSASANPPGPLASPHEYGNRALPVPLTPLLGREGEVEQVVRLLDADETRLVTLTGPGGIGKTRLAIEIGHRLHAEFAHGACFVALASVRDPGLVPAAVAQVLGIQEAGDRPASELVLSALSDRHLLLVLDNMEHVVDAAAPWVGEVLGVCPRVKILATSRVALQLAGERRFVVEPLPLPDTATGGDIERIAQSAAVELFVQRAVAVRPDFVLAARNVEAVHGICRALDGLPLAIELAAAWINVLSPSGLLARLEDRFALLRTDSRSVPPRHKTMRDAIGWSFDLLSPDHQRLFRRLSAFPGGFTLDAAEAIGNGEDAGGSGPPVIDLVSGLVDHSLVRAVLAEGDEHRFGMLEVIREYGLEQLERAGETADARDAHAMWCHAVGTKAGKGIEGPDQIASLAHLDAEFDNIRAALAWLTERERIGAAQELAGAISDFLWLRGHYAEGRQLYEGLIAHPDGTGSTVARAGVLTGASVFASFQGDVVRSLETIEEAIAILRRHDVPATLAWTLQCHCSALALAGRHDEGRAPCTESLALGRALGDAWVIAATLNLLGLAAWDRGDRDLAICHWQECVDVSRASGDRLGLSMGLGNLGLASIRAGDTTRAVACLEECEVLARETGDLTNRPAHLMGLSDVARMQGDNATALSYLHEALGAARRIGYAYGTGHALLGLARLALSSGEADHAARLAHEAIEAFRQRGTVYDIAQCLDALADVAIATNDASRAARLVGGTDAALERAGFAREEEAPGEHETRVASFVAALGEDGYRAAWEGGHALATDDAIAEALAYEPAMVTSGPERVPAVIGPAGELSSRELEVLRLMADGLTNQGIADTLYISRRTVASHVDHILTKLDARSRTAAVAYAVRNGLA